jgi:3-phosphoshikimate 1-carboxyvinyltransferase
MHLTIKKTLILKGKVTAPNSKSHSVRALILATLSDGKSILQNVLHADDTQNAIHVCKELGAIVSASDDKLIIESKGPPFKISNSEIHSGNSGITTHFLMPILGLRKNSDEAIILNCSEQMRARPIKPLVDALTHLGLHIHYLKNKNTLPIRLSGKLIGGKTEVDGTTSQYLSALLFALPCAQSDSEITVTNLQERPYVEMTLDYLKTQSIQLHHQILGNKDIYKIKGGQHYQANHLSIPGDFSSASYLIAAAVLLPGEVIVQGLDMTDAQGDKKLISILQVMGADIVVQSSCLHIRGGKPLTGIKIDVSDIPDLLPTLAVIGTYASGKTEMNNAAHARIKETDRIHSMAEGLTRLGAKVEQQQEKLTVYQSQLRGNHVKGYGDHRTVMALSVAGMMAEGTTFIDDGDAIDKTFPRFVTVMQSLGAKMEISDA